MGWDDDAGYDYGDPKHPSYAERMCEAGDLARKRAKENPPEFAEPADDEPQVPDAA